MPKRMPSAAVSQTEAAVGEAADGEEPLLEDDFSAQEADTRHDALRHTVILALKLKSGGMPSHVAW